ncbi:hypothetical protein NQ066_21015, partial [Escherichia coli]|nr:hypothetical protein [Escherichia coli]
PGKSFFSAHEVSTCKISGCLSYRILDSGPDGTQTTLTFMLFIGYIVLVLKHPDLKRTFNIPGGKGVKLVVAIVGLLTSIMAFIVSFLPPDNIQGDSTDMYVELLVVSFLVVLALPFILYAVHDRKGKANTGVTLEPINSQNAPKGHFFLHPRARSPHYIVMNDKKH